MLFEEIQDLKENLERKEYLLQFNEQKYYQYEKVLRDLILNQNTPEPVKIQLKVKIENSELFVPKDDKKITNIIIDNIEMHSQLETLKSDNNIMRQQLEQISERGQKLIRESSLKEEKSPDVQKQLKHMFDFMN